MSIISIRLPDELLQSIDNEAQTLNLSRTEYIRKAIEHMHATVEKELRKERLKKASLKVRAESLRINQALLNFSPRLGCKPLIFGAPLRCSPIKAFQLSLAKSQQSLVVKSSLCYD